ncbi:MAG: outer membrane lipoprotein-sorting protein [Deltaproteobacteria bacterium]|nr:outer membrane lipoprotein-sorting protein [Deltaproteobacteria bacterium]
MSRVRMALLIGWAAFLNGTAFAQHEAVVPAAAVYSQLLFSENFPLIENSFVSAAREELYRKDTAALADLISKARAIREAYGSILKRHGVPIELIYLTLFEKELRGRPFGASERRIGRWFIAPDMARALGLSVDRMRDERADTQREANAAAKLLKNFYLQFLNWDLALAAFYLGPVEVKEISALSKKQNFWEMCRIGLMPRSGCEIVARLTALVSHITESDHAASDLAEAVFKINGGMSYRYITSTVLLRDGLERQRYTAERAFNFTASEAAAAYIRFSNHPRLAGLGLLSSERKGASDSVLVYIPRERRLENASSGRVTQLLDSVGLSVDDFLPRAPGLDHHRLLGGRTVNGKRCHVLESVPRAGDESTYGSRVQCIDDESKVPLLIEYYDKYGALVKTYEASKIGRHDGTLLAEEFSVRLWRDAATALSTIIPESFSTNVSRRIFTEQHLRFSDG